MREMPPRALLCRTIFLTTSSGLPMIGAPCELRWASKSTQQASSDLLCFTSYIFMYGLLLWSPMLMNHIETWSVYIIRGLKLCSFPIFTQNCFRYVSIYTTTVAIHTTTLQDLLDLQPHSASEFHWMMPNDVKRSHCQFEKICLPKADVAAAAVPL